MEIDLEESMFGTNNGTTDLIEILSLFLFAPETS